MRRQFLAQHLAPPVWSAADCKSVEADEHAPPSEMPHSWHQGRYPRHAHGDRRHHRTSLPFQDHWTYVPSILAEDGLVSLPGLHVAPLLLLLSLGAAASSAWPFLLQSRCVATHIRGPGSLSGRGWTRNGWCSQGGNQL